MSGGVESVSARADRNYSELALLAASLNDSDPQLFERDRDWIKLSVDYREVLDYSRPEFRDLVVGLRDQAFGAQENSAAAWAQFHQSLIRRGITADAGEPIDLCRTHLDDAVYWARLFEDSYEIYLILRKHYEVDEDEDAWRALVAYYDRLRRTRFAALSAAFAAYEAGYLQIASHAIDDEAILRELEHGERWSRLFKHARRERPASPELSQAVSDFEATRRLRHDLVHASLALRTVRNENLIAERTKPQTLFTFLRAIHLILTNYSEALGVRIDLPPVPLEHAD